MIDLNEIYLEALKISSPMPWTLHECNDSMVCVKDSRGNVLFAQSFEDLDELSEESRGEIIDRAKTLGLWLTSFSNDICPRR